MWVFQLSYRYKLKIKDFFLHGEELVVSGGRILVFFLL